MELCALRVVVGYWLGGILQVLKSLRWLLVFLWLSVVVFSARAAAPAEDASKWESDIAQFEAADREHPPAEGVTLFVGSSSIRLWKTLAEDFPGRAVLNRGFGGSHMSDLLAYTDRLVVRYRPATVLVYEGDNDLAAGKKPRRIAREFRRFAARVHQALPQSHLAFLSVKPSPARRHLQTLAAETNERIARFCAGEDWLSYVDVYWPLMDAAGQPRPELFVADGLHLNADGYKIWAEVVRRHLLAHGR